VFVSMVSWWHYW